MTEAVNQIVAALRKFPRQTNISLTAKGENLDTNAEKELNECCKIITESIKKLDHFRPDSKKPGPMDEANNGLLDASTAAAKATGYLTQCALHAQIERSTIGILFFSSLIHFITNFHLYHDIFVFFCRSKFSYYK